MKKSVCGINGALALALCCLLCSVQANAQPPIRPTVDENHVDLVSGQINLSVTDLVIGQLGAGGLSFGRLGLASPWAGQGWYSGSVVKATGPTNTDYTVVIADSSESFTQANSPPNSPIVSVQGRGSSLSEDATSFTYTAPDGTVAVFLKSLINVIPGSVGMNITSLTLPDGEVRTYNYVSVSVCPAVGGCSTPPTWRRLQSLTNNRGYQMKVIYVDSRINTTLSFADGLAWYTLAGAIGVNMAYDYCDPLANQCTGMTNTYPSVTYSGYSVTDQLNNTSTYTWDGSYADPFSIRLAGSQSDDVTYHFNSSTGSVASVTKNGRAWNYSFTATASTFTTVVTDPLSRQSTYVFDATTRSITSYTNTAGETITYQNDTSGRPTLVAAPTGEARGYQYDLRGNVTQVTAYSMGGTPSVLSTASYDATCTTTTAKKCNKPNWTTDALGNQTDYVYDNAHGNPTSISLPAVGGVRPVTSYTYTAYAAYYKNSLGTLIPGTNVYYLTSVAQCRTAASCAGTGDELVTDTGYGANNTPNNRLPVQVTVRDGAGTLVATTALVYDAVGNLTSVDGPLAVDTTVTRYDILRRVIGTVGPDPDGAGSRLNIGVRTTYDSRGLPASVETGTLPGQSEADWGSFSPSQSIVREFDADRRLTKTSLLAGGTNGTTYSVEQTSYDNMGRVDCRTTRMNPDGFASLPAACTASAAGPFGPDRIVRYGYDQADRVTTVISGYGQPNPITEQAMNYVGGRLSTLADGNGNTTTYDYDPYGRLDHVYYPSPTIPGNSSTTDYEEYFYDANFRVTSFRKRSSDVIQTPRDALGRITQKIVPAFNAPAGSEDVYFSYDNQGRVLSALYGSTTGPGIVQTYDALGRLQTRSVFGRTLTYGYDLAGRRTQLTYPGADNFSVTYGYTNVGELSSITDSGGTQIATYSYDELGFRTSLSRPNGALTTYEPDGVKRLHELTQDLSGTSFDSVATFAYNPAGQIASKTQTNDAAYTWTPSIPNASVAAQFDGQNKVTNFANTNVTHDEDADVATGINTLTYAYDALGQLRTASGGTNTVTVSYDPTGMLRRLTAGATTTDFLYDGDDLVAQYDGSGNLLHRYVHGQNFDEPLVDYQGSGTTNRTWLHTDERGSIIAATDGAGMTTSSVKYTSDGASGTLISPFGYTGQVYLPELQLYYYKARMYSPNTRRFVQPDPIRHAAGTNFYAYAANDPTNRRDPFGLQDVGPIDCNQSSGMCTPVPAAIDEIIVVGGYCNWRCQLDRFLQQNVIEAARNSLMLMGGATYPTPPSNIPGGPYTPAGQGQPDNVFYGPKQPQGQRSQVNYVPGYKEKGGHPSAPEGYFKRALGDGTWQRYKLDGTPASPEEVHPTLQSNPESGVVVPAWEVYTSIIVYSVFGYEQSVH